MLTEYIRVYLDNKRLYMASEKVNIFLVGCRSVG